MENVHAKVIALMPLLQESKNCTQRTTAWFERRATMITCSDIEEAINDPEGKKKIFRMKTDQIANDQKFSAFAQRIMDQGTVNEPMIRKHYENLNPGENSPIIEEFGCVRHSEVPGRDKNDRKLDWLGGSPDGIVVKTGRLLEIKYAVSRRLITGVLPKKYFAQIQALMEVFNLDECDYIEYAAPKCVGESPKFQVIRIERDRKWFASVLPKLESFWNKVLEYRQLIENVARAQCRLLSSAVAVRPLKPLNNIYREWERAVKKLGPAYKIKQYSGGDGDETSGGGSGAKRKRSEYNEEMESAREISKQNKHDDL